MPLFEYRFPPGFKVPQFVEPKGTVWALSEYALRFSEVVVWKFWLKKNKNND